MSTHISMVGYSPEFLELNVENRFIVVEGIDGSGKTTLLNRMKNELTWQGKEVLVANDPPGEILRALLKHKLRKRKDAKLAVELLFDARRGLLENIILPAIETGKHVLCDRFTASTYAYQGSGFGVCWDWIREVEIAKIGHVEPDATIFLDVPISTAMERVKNRGEVDAIESNGHEFFESVIKGYNKYLFDGWLTKPVFRINGGY